MGKNPFFKLQKITSLIDSCGAGLIYTYKKLFCNIWNIKVNERKKIYMKYEMKTKIQLSENHMIKYDFMLIWKQKQLNYKEILNDLKNYIIVYDMYDVLLS